MSWGCSSESPLRRLEVMDVDVIALADIGHGLTDGMAVLEDRITILDGLQGDLMTDRDAVQRLHLDGLVGFHDPSGQLLAGFDVFGEDDADGILFVVHNELGDRKSTRLNSSH